MIVHPEFFCFEPAETDARYLAGVRVQDDGEVQLYLSQSGRPILPAVNPPWTPLQLLKSGSLICRSLGHREPGTPKDVIGVYNCEHLAAVLSVRQQDSVLLENILSSLFDMRGSSTTVSLGIQIEQDVWRDVWFTQENNGVYSITVDGHNSPHSAGYITPAYEGFQVVRDLVVQHYEAWTEASRTMCTSTQHWKSGNTRGADLKDRICLDTDSMCYPCAKRVADALWEFQHPSNDAGFDSLVKPRPKKSESYVTVPAPATVPMSPFAGGPPTTSGSRRVRSDGTVEIFDGKKWQPAHEVPFDLSTFCSEVDEQQWNRFLGARDSV